MKFASLYQNDCLVEHDMVEQNDLESYFKDSYKHHTGHRPSKHQVSVYLQGQAVVEIQGNLSSTWQAY